MENMFVNEFLDQCRSGKKTFEKINLQFSDIQDSMKGIMIKDSRLFFITFNGCDISNAKFINCEIFFGSFYNCNMTNTVFENCRIDYTYYERGIFDNTAMKKCSISWSGMFFSGIGGLDMATSACFKVFTDPSQLTQEDIEQGMKKLMPQLDRLDISIRAKIKEIIKNDIKNWGRDEPKPQNKPATYEKVPNESYNPLQNIIHEAVHAYQVKNPYKTKHGYER